ncbi:MAG TPA: FKBP-type peptidyl-prolyl cis-trans isomerase [Flavobacteriales bacterium]|nr:FKBP-type peptidyl-prolyl cis-trans isomerase [Flavobacteriales bacterium]
MIVRSLAAVVSLTLLASCSQGQKGRNTEMKTEMDSVSYAIGADIGGNLKRGKIDSINAELLHAGLVDGLDSNLRMDNETLQGVMQAFMMKMQMKMQAEEAAKGETNRAAGEQFLAENAKRTGVVTTPSGLQYEVVTMGTGAKPTAEDAVKVHYHGSFVDGEVFDSSVQRGEPVTMPVTQWIPAFVEALQMMPAGSKWKLYIPSDLAYGSSGNGRIPANSTLLFDLELLEVVKKK